MGEIWILVRNLEHCPECAVRRDRFPWGAAAAVAVDSGFAVTRVVSKRTMVQRKAIQLGFEPNIPESKPDKQALAHLIIAIGHILQRALLIMDLLVLSHICLVAEIIEVPSISLGVKFRHEWSPLITQTLEVDLGEIVMRMDFFDILEPLLLPSNQFRDEIPRPP